MFTEDNSYSHHITNYKDENGSCYTLEWYTDRTEDLILTNVWVKPEYRGNGFGNEILKCAEKSARLGCFKRLFVKVAGLTWQNEWYGRHGFEFIETDKYDKNYIWRVKQIND